MSYTARFSKAFLKKFQKLPRIVKLRITVSLREILVKPDSGIMLAGPLKGQWKARVGKYRVIYTIDEGQKLVVFYDVELRKKVY